MESHLQTQLSRDDNLLLLSSFVIMKAPSFHQQKQDYGPLLEFYLRHLVLTDDALLFQC